MQATSGLEQALHEFRRMLPGTTATAQAIDRGEAWERIALKAVDDGYIESAHELGRLLEACLKRTF